MRTFYVYDDTGINVACVYAKDINEAYKEAHMVTGLDIINLSVEQA